MFGLVVLVFFVLVAMFAPLLADELGPGRHDGRRASR